jgi:hypothetical protein
MKESPTLNFKLRTLNLRWAVVVLVLIACNDCTAQIQQAWVARYNNGILDGTNQAVKMALDSSGNIYVTGFSQNTNTNLGYVTIKYASNGTPLWSARYDDTNFVSATPSGLVLDTNNSVIVTGNALTVKYDSNGNQLWSAPYAGSAIAIDPGGNPVVTGMESNFSTVKLSPAGSNLWQTTYVEPIGPVWSQLVLVDSNSNVYVAGSDTDVCYSAGCYEQLLIVKYDQNGNRLWSAGNNQGGASISSVRIGGAALDAFGNLYIVADFGMVVTHVLMKYNATGSVVWTTYQPPPTCLEDVPHDLILDKLGNVIVTGPVCYVTPNYSFATLEYGTYKSDANGTYILTNTYPPVPVLPSAANSVTVDSANNCYVTGYSPGTNSANDIVTIKYDPNGNQIWLQRYTSPGNGNAAGNAIAVDNNGNVYVTGYDTTTAGGTEIVTIKYSPVTVQRRSDGTVILQAQGSPGESFDIQASADLLNWLDLGPVTADTNGLMQFADTNAPNYSSRFYYTNPQ